MIFMNRQYLKYRIHQFFFHPITFFKLEISRIMRRILWRLISHYRLLSRLTEIESQKKSQDSMKNAYYKAIEQLNS